MMVAKEKFIQSGSKVKKSKYLDSIGYYNKSYKKFTVAEKGGRISFTDNAGKVHKLFHNDSMADGVYGEEEFTDYMVYFRVENNEITDMGFGLNTGHGTMRHNGYMQVSDEQGEELIRNAEKSHINSERVLVSLLARARKDGISEISRRNSYVLNNGK